MTSCCVVSSISATRSGVGGGALRTGSTTSAGTRPAAACASSTSVSTRHQARTCAGRSRRGPSRAGCSGRSCGHPSGRSARRGTGASSRSVTRDLRRPLRPTGGAMLRRASDLPARARERIRAAREHDPHDDWHGDDAVVTGGTSRTSTPTTWTTPTAPTTGRSPEPRRRRSTDAGRRRCRSAAPSPARPTSTARSARAASAARRTGRPGRGRRRPAGSCRRRPRRQPEDGVPNGLRTAASWSWRLVVVVAAFYAAALAGRVHGRRRRAGDRGAAAGRAAAARGGRARAARLAAGRWPRSTMLVVGLGVVAGIITLVVKQFTAGYADLADQVGQGLDAGPVVRRPQLADHPQTSWSRRSPTCRTASSRTRTPWPPAR